MKNPNGPSIEDQEFARDCERDAAIAEAESIIMAVELGIFRGTQGEYANALLVVAIRNEF
jgi:hypothetical protein